MKKPLKIVAWALGIVVGLVVLLLLLSPLWLGQTAGMIANCVVPGMTGTDFNVEKIRINLYTGTLRVEKLRLANPKGYDAEDAVAIDLLSVKVAPFSVFGSTVKIKDVTIENPYVSYLGQNGTNNFEAILANMNSGKEEEAPEAKPDDGKDEGEGKKVVIDRLSIAGTRVRYEMITLPVPNIVLSGLGTSEGGVTIENVGLEVWEKITSSFTSAGGTLGGALKSLGSGTSALIGNAGDGAAKSVDAIGEGAKKAADTVSDGAKKATEALGNLFK